MWDQTTFDSNWALPLNDTEQKSDSGLIASGDENTLHHPLINLSSHIEAHLGPQRALPLNWLIPMTAVYVLILVFGFVGNLITILVIFRFRYMQTITNLYLCNLAITDLISLMLSKFSPFSLIHFCSVFVFLFENRFNLSLFLLLCTLNLSC